MLPHFERTTHFTQAQQQLKIHLTGAIAHGKVVLKNYRKRLRVDFKIHIKCAHMYCTSLFLKDAACSGFSTNANGATAPA